MTPRLKTRSIARCTVAFSSSRMPPRICSTNFGGAFQSAEIGWSGPPFCVGMENALIPALRSDRIIRIVANHIQQSPRRPYTHRFGVLRHQQHVTALLDSDFTHELAKSFCSRQIQRAAGFASVPVSAGNQRPLPLLSEFTHQIIFLRAARGIDFERMQKLHRASQEPLQSLVVPVHSHASLRPQRMVEHHQHIWVTHPASPAIPPGVRSFGFRVYAARSSNDRLRLLGRQIVHAKVEDGSRVGNAPLQRDRRLRRFPRRSQQQRRLDRVVIRQRDQALESNRILDLIFFRLVSAVLATAAESSRPAQNPPGIRDFRHCFSSASCSIGPLRASSGIS